jgi:SAM-dependent methyltransferase
MEAATKLPTPADPTNAFEAPTGAPEGHDWRSAGDAWGRRARDWACLFEHYATDVIHAMFDRIDVNPGTRLLDVACGSGLALRFAGSRGAHSAGIDASESLVAIASERNPDSDVRVGDMFALPWSDEAFDAVISVNGIWGGCEQALAEARRVLRPGGRIAISFWGVGPPLDLALIFRVFAKHSPTSHKQGMRRTNDIASPGVAEQMLETAGFSILERGHRVSVTEWPDAETAWRAVASVGPAVPALESVGEEALRPPVLDALSGCLQPSGMYRIHNDQQFVIAERTA